MAAPEGWADPLAQHAPIDAHPTHSSPAESPLSSAPANPGKYAELREKSQRILSDYILVSSQDDTVKVLGASLDPSKLRSMRTFLVDAVLKPMKSAGGHFLKIAASSAVQRTQDIVAGMSMVRSSTRADQEALKDKCLARDDCRCVFSGAYNLPRARKLPPDQRGTVGRSVANTECAHILPFALSKFDENSLTEVSNKAWIWFALYRYFPFIQGKISADTINKPENAITLEVGVHDSFGNYSLAFEPLDTAHQYRPHTFVQGFTLVGTENAPDHITFRQHNPSVPMPDPDFLRLHFQVAKILDVSDIGLKIEAEWHKRAKMPSEMSPDGSTDLGHAIRVKMLMDI
ncbi:hypothetical protein C8A01DRAFT_42469 [Parachaetomium inaequale]|uniref:HNH nuclease domain-containing protein n=1 Tax=Parachaetomium inaequale TaxID=2588326 RepID=A0AAN6PUJ2_9PEZI|nr:hypothetical protein C8A01DRAFT_42469 [Parachaetomium inaequale]